MRHMLRRSDHNFKFARRPHPPLSNNIEEPVPILPERFRSSEFFRNVFTLTAGTFAAQVFTVLLTPVLTRLYSPADYALFAIFTSLVAQISVGASLRLEMALPVIAEESEASALSRLAVRLTALISLFSLTGIAVYLVLQTNGASGSILLLAPFSIFLTGLMQVLNYFSSRQKTFRLNSLSRIILSLGTGLLSALFGFLGWGGNGLIFGSIAGLILGTAVLFFFLRKNVWPEGPQKHYPNRHFFSRYRQFITINTPHALVDTLEVSGILFLMNRYFKADEVGSYFFAYRILKLPVTLVGSAVFQVFYQKLSEARQQGRDLRPMIRSVCKKMAVIGFPVFALLMFAAPPLFSFVFGAKWTLAGELASKMSPWLFFNFIASAVSSVTFLFNRQRGAFMIAVFDISLRLGLLVLAGCYFDFSWAVTAISTVSAGIMIFAIWFYLHISRPNAPAEPVS